MAYTAPSKNLEELLVKDGFVTEAQLRDLETEHLNSGKSIEELIMGKGLVEGEKLNQLKAKLFNTEFIEIATKEIPSYVLDYVPEAIATKNVLIPFYEDGTNLHVAMADPLNVQMIAFVEKRTGLRVKPFLADSDAILSAIDRQYGKSLGSEVTAALKDAGGGLGSTDAKTLEDIEEEQIGGITVKNAPIARIVANVLQNAVLMRASDVHIEPSEENTRVRFRVDGVMEEKLSLPKKYHDNLVTRIKILSNLKIDEKRLPQDGRFKIEVGKEIIDLRISTLPTVFGEKVVMRLLEGQGNLLQLSDLGLRGDGLKKLEDNVSRTVGMILVTGPTGSGKTNTLAAAISRVNTPKVNIITLEDPVEIRINGVNQVQINPSAGLTFASGLRSILRQDPDVIMVGEVRDTETAELAIHAALTGHLVFSTLHTNSAAGALPRLYDMHVEPFLLASTVNLVIAQRLVRTLCNECKQSVEVAEAELTEFRNVLGNLWSKVHKDSTEKTVVFKAKGCKKCGGTGYAGRTGIFEVMSNSQAISKAIIEKQPEEAIQTIAVSEGMTTLLQDGYIKVLEGYTTLEEVLRVAKD